MTQPNPNTPEKPDQSEEALSPSETPTKPPQSATNADTSTADQPAAKQDPPTTSAEPETKKPLPTPEATTDSATESAEPGEEDDLRQTRPLLHNGATTNRLPTESVIALENSGLIYGHATDVGQHRKNNEDSLLAYGFSISSMDEFPDFGVFIIADGMGGHKDGDRASATAVRSIATGITRKLYFNILRGTPMTQLPPVNELLVEEVENANAEIRSLTSDGGTTCTAALVIGRRVFIAHTGDSRAYIVKMDGIERITRDHSLAERLRETGVMTEQEAAMHPQGNQLYSALGMSDDPRIDSWTRTLGKGTRLLLCSDGLWNMVPDGQIYSIMMQHPVPQDACNRLVAAANENGGLDNISAIILYMP
ncbi:protein phosphatase 2C domain-containing protein [Phototrophicus methaneseepsis]|uniref:Protein phosphatase 2C domain-containing protein n=1 Tax=Phototrophicus methaneseepsis TaxID=2710758 RepID=A0A7S8ECR7_9CHLR|nr:protein phosphatase 2C domain-containing protein [Phototrophicus methaneseepsis]QPC84353.1 protein phosphatase 2C domain-containing protein [Phototrophicus methaneseepsis]